MKTSNHLLRRLTAALLAAVLALSIALPVFASDDGDTIYINSVSDLLSLAKSCAYDQWSVGKTVILQKDLSLEGMLWEPIPSFSGQFKGNGHTISDLTITGQYSPAGLFGIVEEQGSIESLSVRGIVSVSDAADTTTGGIVGINHGTLINCQFTGVVTGVTEGKAKITVKAGKRSADCTITVTNDAIEVKSLKLDKDRAEMQIGDSLTLTATMQPANAPDDLVSWASSDPNIATVKKGIVVATSSGSVTITASAGSCTATCQITVQAPSRVDSVTAETASATLDLGGTKTGTITFHIHGQNLDSLQSTVKVYAADGSVVSLGQPVRTGNGTDDTYSVTATAAAAGSTSVILQITGADGTTHSAACTVTVKESKTILDLIPGVNG